MDDLIDERPVDRVDAQAPKTSLTNHTSSRIFDLSTDTVTMCYTDIEGCINGCGVEIKMPSSFVCDHSEYHPSKMIMTKRHVTDNDEGVTRITVDQKIEVTDPIKFTSGDILIHGMDVKFVTYRGECNSCVVMKNEERRKWAVKSHPPGRSSPQSSG